MKISVVLHRQHKRVFDDVLIISLDMHKIPDLKTSHTELEFIPKISWELWDFLLLKKKILIWIKCVQVSEWKWKKKFNQKLNSVIIFFIHIFYFDSLKKKLNLKLSNNVWLNVINLLLTPERNIFFFYFFFFWQLQRCKS